MFRIITYLCRECHPLGIIENVPSDHNSQFQGQTRSLTGCYSLASSANIGVYVWSEENDFSLLLHIE